VVGFADIDSSSDSEAGDDSVDEDDNEPSVQMRPSSTYQNQEDVTLPPEVQEDYDTVACGGDQDHDTDGPEYEFDVASVDMPSEDEDAEYGHIVHCNTIATTLAPDTKSRTTDTDCVEDDAYAEQTRNTVHTEDRAAHEPSNDAATYVNTPTNRPRMDSLLDGVDASIFHARTGGSESDEYLVPVKQGYSDRSLDGFGFGDSPGDAGNDADASVGATTRAIANVNAGEVEADFDSDEDYVESSRQSQLQLTPPPLHDDEEGGGTQVIAVNPAYDNPASKPRADWDGARVKARSSNTKVSASKADTKKQKAKRRIGKEFVLL
jgi:hypothetical protein